MVTGRDEQSSVVKRFSEIVSTSCDLPLPGRGNTWRRFEILSALAAEDLSLARLAEGHADALAILEESGSGNRNLGASYGVWAARTGSTAVMAVRVPGGWQLTGRKPFCSGAGLLDRALVTAESPDGYRLFDIATSETVVGAVPNSWPAVGMADSLSQTLDFGGPVLPDAAAIGPPGFYTERPGFWFGACGVAACWFGGAHGLVSGLLQYLGDDSDEITLMEIGELVSELQTMSDALRSVAMTIDADPTDDNRTAKARALAVRHITHRACESVLRRTAAAGGARPLSHDRAQAQRAADLYVYLAQHHGGRDASILGRLYLEKHG